MGRDARESRIIYVAVASYFISDGREMLPRIGALELEFDDALAHYVRSRSRRDGLMREIHGHVIHEGGATGIQRTPNEFEKTEMVAAQAEAKISFAEIESLDANYIIKLANEIADQFGRQLSQNLFKTMDQATAKTGQRVDGRGTPLTNELIMEMLSKMPINFEKSPHGDVSIVVAPQMLPRLEALERELNEDPALRSKMDALMDKKRNEFREREINRNLAG